jgi:hypothetical protein
VKIKYFDKKHNFQGTQNKLKLNNYFQNLINFDFHNYLEPYLNLNLKRILLKALNKFGLSHTLNN